ncbi:hypervirulence associated TUDOR domain-containing protein [Sphingobium cloacae]|uniref:DUF2945 domain-containing protein n=1 Tax=Sphingobium cloacae TaxID=120107 RepID=UPI00082A115F|nr:DUF2945 domain-containing protein [Sphingobium cloacae]
MSNGFHAGLRVRWNRGQSVGRGRIAACFDHQVEYMIEGTRVRRNGSPQDPACLVIRDAGGEVLKLRSELSLT